MTIANKNFLPPLITNAAADVRKARQDITMSIKGSKQGELKGLGKRKGKEGQIEVIGLNFAVDSPRDPSTGLPTGRRVYDPVIVFLPLQESIHPQFFQACTTNENMTEIKIHLWAAGGLPGQAGTQLSEAQKQVYTITLTNSTISHSEIVTTDMGVNVVGYQFVFEKIEMEYVPTGVMYADSWMTDNNS